MAQNMTVARKQEAERSNGEATRANTVYRPTTDIYETGDRVMIVADMPGVAQKNVDVTLDRGVLTIRGTVAVEPHEGYSRVYAEYGEGDYERVFTLSEEIDREKIKATHKDGVLTLELPKAEAAKTKKIRVNAA